MATRASNKTDTDEFNRQKKHALMSEHTDEVFQIYADAKAKILSDTNLDSLRMFCHLRDRILKSIDKYGAASTDAIAAEVAFKFSADYVTAGVQMLLEMGEIKHLTVAQEGNTKGLHLIVRAKAVTK